MPFWQSRNPEQLVVNRVRFLGEQDGPPERILKGKLADSFRVEKLVARAYLVRADLGEGQGVSVVLALVAEPRAEPRLVKQVGAIFGSVFNSKEHLDIIFVSEGQERELKESCRAFFVARSDAERD